jgi:HAD superfamily hydrolase (TIGR01490 family)
MAQTREIPVRAGAQARQGAVTASYFDVDGTLVRTNLMHTAVYYLANEPDPVRSAGKLARLALRSPLLLAAELRDRRTFNELLFECFAGMTEDRIMILADDTYEWAMRRGIYEGARDLVSRSREAGHEVVLVSGALDFLLSRLAADLGADSFVGNRLEIHAEKATGKLLRPVVAGPTKARLICDHARKHGHDLAECFAYSDSYSDLPMLSVVGRPAAVNPDAKLERLARAYQWPIIYFDKKAA